MDTGLCRCNQIKTWSRGWRAGPKSNIWCPCRKRRDAEGHTEGGRMETEAEGGGAPGTPQKLREAGKICPRNLQREPNPAERWIFDFRSPELCETPLGCFKPPTCGHHPFRVPKSRPALCPQPGGLPRVITGRLHHNKPPDSGQRQAHGHPVCPGAAHPRAPTGLLRSKGRSPLCPSDLRAAAWSWPQKAGPEEFKRGTHSPRRPSCLFASHPPQSLSLSFPLCPAFEAGFPHQE